ncbi:ISSod13, transposase [Escherichia coli E22]|nr:ISSod13, transposase [Escherichia coli E22]
MALQQEWNGRHQRGMESRLKQARLPWVQTLEQFDFTFQPNIDRKVVRELAGLAFVERSENVILRGPPGVGRIYQQTFVDTYSKVAHCKLYVTKTPITAADLLNDRVLPFYASQGLPMLRILTDRGTEYCGKVEQHDYQLYLAINDIEHTKTKAMSPQTNGICERFHKTILNEFYQVTFRKKLYGDLDTLQSDLDEWLAHYNNERTHQGKMCNGRTPMETLLDGKRIWAEKNLSQM